MTIFDQAIRECKIFAFDYIYCAVCLCDWFNEFYRRLSLARETWLVDIKSTDWVDYFLLKLTFSYLKFNLKPTSKSLKTAGTRSPVFKTIISPGTKSLASKEWISPFLILEFSNFKKYILFWLIQKDEAISQLFQEHAGSIRFKKIRCKARIYTWLMWNHALINKRLR